MLTFRVTTNSNATFQVAIESDATNVYVAELARVFESSKNIVSFTIEGMTAHNQQEVFGLHGFNKWHSVYKKENTSV